MSIEETIVNRLINYMKIDSTTGHEEAFGDAVFKDLADNGWVVEKQYLSDGRRFNVFATFGRSNKSEIKMIWNTHLDTVPPFILPTSDAEKIYGRGSCDAKGQLACMVTAAVQIARTNAQLAHKIGLLFVVGEEVDHVGMEAANSLGFVPNYVVVGEPTELKFGTVQKGALKVRITATGVAGHSGYPETGTSAVHLLIPVLHSLLEHEWPNDTTLGATTLNIGKINGGQALNAWAQEAHADVFFRITTSVDHIYNEVLKFVKGDVKVEKLSFNERVLLHNPPFDYPQTQVAFNTDLSYFKPTKPFKAFLFGAGSIKTAHSEYEFVSKTELIEATNVLIRLAEALLSNN